MDSVRIRSEVSQEPTGAFLTEARHQKVVSLHAHFHLWAALLAQFGVKHVGGQIGLAAK